MRLNVSWRGLAVTLLVMTTIVSPIHLPAAGAADLVPPNRGFESDLAGWTQFGAGGNTATTERAFEGTKSAKVVDGSSVTSTGLESTRMSAAKGKYGAFVQVYVISGRPDLYLRFYDRDGRILGNHKESFSGATGTWTSLGISGTAPDGTTRVSALVYSSEGNVGTAYFDDLSISVGITNLGVQIDHTMINGTTFGIGANQDKVYGVFTGTTNTVKFPGLFATIDVDTGSMVGSPIPLGAATGAWAATTATDGTVYLGSYSNASVYRHVPGSGTVTNLGKAIDPEGNDGQEFVWCLTPGSDGRIYGGTYQPGGYFKYEPGNGFTTLGSFPIWEGKHYVRSIAFDETQGATYLGVGTKAALIRFDRVTGAKENILPPQYANISMVGGLTFTGGRLFAVMSNGQLSVLNIVKNADGSVTPIEEAAFGSASLAVSPARDGKVYFTSGGRLHSYDIASRTFAALDVTATVSPTRLGWVRLDDQSTYPGETLVVVGVEFNRTYLVKYNRANPRASRTAEVTGTPWQPAAIRSVAAGPDGKIYTGGYLTGGTGVYRPLHGDGDDDNPDQVFRTLSQTDSILSHNGKMYLGVYPSARIHEYDPAQPWTTSNPRLMATLGADGQDRPYGLAAGGGRLFVGTVPKYGEYDGALTIFDLATGQYTVKRNFVADQGVIALAYHNGKVFGGTTIRPGLGAEEDPKADDARFFVYDVATGTKTEYRLALSDGRMPTAITAVAVIDGKIWGLAEGHLFIFDPATNRFSTGPVPKFTVNYPDYGTWGDAAIATTPADVESVYITIGGRLYRLAKSSLAVTDLGGGARGLTTDRFGNLYYYSDVYLHRYVP